jgi:hypothetical protein
VSNAAERLAQALRDLIDEAAQAAVERDRPTPTPVPVAKSPKVPEDNLAFCPWCDQTTIVNPPPPHGAG